MRSILAVLASAVAASPVLAGPPGEPAAAGSGSSWRLVTGVTFASLGVATLGLSTYLAAEMGRTQDDSDAAREQAALAPTRAAYDAAAARVIELNRDGRRLETAHLVTLTSGLFLAALGGGLLVTERRGSPAPDPPDAAPLVLPAAPADEPAPRTATASGPSSRVDVSVASCGAGLLLQLTW